MDTQGFSEFLKKRELPDEKIDRLVEVAGDFEDFLTSSKRPRPAASADQDDVNDFSASLISVGRNTIESYHALALYGRFLGNDRLFVSTVELIDGAEALDNLHDKLAAFLGEKTRDEIFRGIELPPLGAPASEKPKVTQAVMERLEQLVDPDTCKALLSQGLRDLQDEWFGDKRKLFLESENVDEFLTKKGDKFVAELRRIKEDDGLFFTQKITDDVIEYVEAHAEIRQGVRDGDIVYEAKIPYMAIEYLKETDKRMKRYYYCHCHWVRESIRSEEFPVSPMFCNCSAGFHKRSWEIALDRPLEAEIVECVLKGDAWCKVAIYLPKELLPEYSLDEKEAGS
jgi:hypothetical protein